MKKILWFFILFSLVIIPQAFPYGSWFDDFEEYADQNAMDNPSNPLYKWDSADGKAKGILDTAGFHIKTKSMRCQQYPTETRPTRKIGQQQESNPWIPFQGCLTLWVYDDGADIKSFDIQVKNATHYVGIGLRDNQSGVATQYTCNKDGVVINTGISRSAGWHVFQFSVNNTEGTEAASGLPYVIGTEMMIDARKWQGNILASMTEVTDLTIYTNFGNPTDENKVWIDSVEWSSLFINPMGVPKQARMGNIDDFQPPNGLNDWAVLSESNTELTNAPDGLDPTNLYLDAFDPDGGLKGFYFTGVYTVPKTGNYILECPYMNGPTWAVHNPWPDLTFTINNSVIYNEGSTTTGTDWAYVGAPGGMNWNYRRRFAMNKGDTFQMEVTGDPLSSTPNCFVRLSSVELRYINQQGLSTDQRTWNLYE